jgi:hypothetical protein
MKNVILIPLFRPGLKHLLLLKSVISACECLENVAIHAVADGPRSEVEWPTGTIARLLEVAGASGIELCMYSLVRSSGYPKCYQVLMGEAITVHDPTLFHFVDQDDYCLPVRFQDRSSTHTQASGCIVVDERLSTRTRLHFTSQHLTAVLETPAPGMTYSVPRDIIDRYLELCAAHPVAANSAHDFVIGQISKRDKKLLAAPAASMLYIQHTENTIGYLQGLPWLYAKLKSPRAILARTLDHAQLINVLYSGRHWIRCERLHHSRVRSLLYKIILNWSKHV